MPKLKEFIEERTFITDRISTQVRIIGIGLLATTWSLLFGKVDSFKDIILQCRTHFIIIGTIAMTALALDYLQYLFSYTNIDKKLSEMEDNHLKESDYNYDDKYYKLSKWSFVGKQVVLLVGLGYFFSCMIYIIIETF
jgi:hypothetical protein